jgi:hypothetical protein
MLGRSASRRGSGGGGGRRRGRLVRGGLEMLLVIFGIERGRGRRWGGGLGM